MHSRPDIRLTNWRLSPVVESRVPSAVDLLGEGSGPRRSSRPLAVSLALALVMLSLLRPALAQEQHRRKLPVLDKLTSGPTRQAFSGKVQSLDLGRNLLNVNTVEGGNTEIFPVKKGTSVKMADGEKLKITELMPGTHVIIYYEQKGDRRTVREIVVLVSSGGEEKKKSTPPS